MISIYNEIDNSASQWLENLMDAGQIPKGKVITKSIAELTAQDLEGSSQVHLFAGIGGWPLALKLAGWPEDMPVWTGSCPCQPFSVAGKRKGKEDERHLWPEMYRLIKECKPPVIFGEQVASPDGIDWMQAVQSDLEAQGYEVGKLDLCAAGVGSPHIRQRIFWVGNRIGKGLEGHGGDVDNWSESRRNKKGETGSTSESCASCNWDIFEWLLCRDNKIRPTQPGLFPLAHGLPRSMGDGSTREQRLGLLAAKRSRVGQLKGYGNAIVPQVAAVFIGPVMEWINCLEKTQCTKS